MFKLLFENESFLIIDKLTQIPCIREGASAGLSDELILDYPYLSNIKDFGFTHRVDNETLGILLVAKNTAYYEDIRALFKEHKVLKTYLARVEGEVPLAEGEIMFPIAHDKNNKKKMLAVKPSYRIYRGKVMDAKTAWTIIDKTNTTTDLLLSTNTGRRHQLRVHLKAIDHPICGDQLYSKNYLNYPALMLIAKSISFICPSSKKNYSFNSELDLSYYCKL